MPGLLKQALVQEADFDVATLQQALLGEQAAEGAVATFTGYVRRDDPQLQAMLLEHYPGMTEKSIAAIQEEAAARWPILAVTVVHRVGRLAPGERIVWVGVAAAHRQAAFSACEFIMDFLKTRAPFWKKECLADGGRWVRARSTDYRKAEGWNR